MFGKCESRLHTCKEVCIGQWSFIGPGSEKKWYSMEENSPQGIWDHIAEKMLVFHDKRQWRTILCKGLS